MSTPDPAATSTPAEGSSESPEPTGTSEINAVPAGDASKEKTASRVPETSTDLGAGPESTEAKLSGPKPSGAKLSRPKASKRAPSTTKSMGESPEGGEQGSDAESEYETICIRRKKPTPFFQRLKRFLAQYLAFDIYMSMVMWEAFKLVIITSQFNWALELLGGTLHIFAAAGKCALKKQCGGSGDRRASDSSGTDKEPTPEPVDKKSSMKSSMAMSSKPSSKPSSSIPGKTPSKAPGSETGEPTATSTTGESGETGTTETSPTTESTEATSSEPAATPAT